MARQKERPAPVRAGNRPEINAAQTLHDIIHREKLEFHGDLTQAAEVLGTISYLPISDRLAAVSALAAVSPRIRRKAMACSMVSYERFEAWFCVLEAAALAEAPGWWLKEVR